MDKKGFRVSLENDINIKSKVKAVNSRITKSASVEKALSVDLDVVVQDDLLMKDLLIKVKALDKNGAKGNAIRKYYKFKNNREFKN